jgi:hypothetical protein
MRRMQDKTKAFEGERGLRRELHGAVFVDTPKFFEKFFDISPTLIKRISKETHTQKYYDGSRWVAFPNPTNTKDFKEKVLYQPFVDVANFITMQRSKEPDAEIDLRWLSGPNRAPTSNDTKAADVKPDIICVRAFPEANPPESMAKESAVVRSKSGKKSQQAPPLKPLKALWRCVQEPLQVKRESSERAASLQLFKYVR